MNCITCGEAVSGQVHYCVKAPDPVGALSSPRIPNYTGSGGGTTCHLCGIVWRNIHACQKSQPDPVGALSSPRGDGVLQRGQCYLCDVVYLGTHRCTRSAPDPARAPFCCPVCDGRGRVPSDFYGETMNASQQIICQSCHGAGIVWAPAA